MLIRSNISMQTPLQPIQNQFRTLKHHSLRRIISRLSAPSSNKFAAYKMINIRLYYFSKILQIVCDPDVLHTHSLCVRAFVYVGSHWTSSWVAWTVESLTLCWSAKSFATSPWIVESFSFFPQSFVRPRLGTQMTGSWKGMNGRFHPVVVPDSLKWVFFLVVFFFFLWAVERGEDFVYLFNKKLLTFFIALSCPSDAAFSPCDG